MLKNSTYYQQTKNMAKIMNKADLAIGAGGIITWERCCLGLPSVVSIVSKNQEDMINAISKKMYGIGRWKRYKTSCQTHIINCKEVKL